MAEAKRFRVYIETRVSTAVELDSEDLAAALEAAPSHGPFVSSNDNTWEQSGDWEALTAYDATPTSGCSRRRARMSGMFEIYGSLSSAEIADLIGYVVTRPRHVNLRQIVVLPTR